LGWVVVSGRLAAVVGRLGLLLLLLGVLLAVAAAAERGMDSGNTEVVAAC